MTSKNIKNILSTKHAGFMYLEVAIALVLMAYSIHTIMAVYTSLVTVYSRTVQHNNALVLATNAVEEWRTNKKNLPINKKEKGYTVHMAPIQFITSEQKNTLSAMEILVSWKDAVGQKQHVTLYASRL